ncbi:uncharacterized protein B0I36DRAFT_379526 [Microdochium trichocladiopsis]|uniref:Carbohydrate-binding module family 19 domain-containing protein n=1 Tax=Microdochium trichocladiopsis TaxID=1682393 RepID=A0A9P9BVS2_9PEZI|nr:uncharacterized protein B0I36DRAFT_379526 [Microdochium trichocladiopsis]KAH7040588.1 hypothetical protein B0I36DRAFT_379526 [Microdochium trichocladiopsis]
MHHLNFRSLLTTAGLLAAVIIVAPLGVSALPTTPSSSSRTRTVEIILPKNCGPVQAPAAPIQSSTTPTAPPAVSTNNNNNSSSNDDDNDNLDLPPGSSIPPDPFFPPAAPEPCPDVGGQLCMWFYPAGPSRMECRADGAYHLLGTCSIGNVCQMDATGKAVCVPQTLKAV